MFPSEKQGESINRSMSAFKAVMELSLSKVKKIFDRKEFSAILAAYNGTMIMPFIEMLLMTKWLSSMESAQSAFHAKILKYSS